jgi:hypothetical protein
VDAPELFAKYPDFKNISVVFERGKVGHASREFAKGVDAAPVIRINAELRNDPAQVKRALVHELTHEIQGQEGRDTGPEISKELSLEEADKLYREHPAEQEARRNAEAATRDAPTPAEGRAVAKPPAGAGKLDSTAAYDKDAAEADAELRELLGDDGGIRLSVKEKILDTVGDLAAGAKGETRFEMELRLVAESAKAGRAPAATREALGARALQGEALRLRRALQNGTLSEAEGRERWARVQARLATWMARGPKAQALKQVDIFAQPGPEPGMLFSVAEPRSTETAARIWQDLPARGHVVRQQ